MNNEIKDICRKCEHHIHCQGKGCAFRSLGNEYCDEVENANNLIKDLQQRIDKAIEYLKDREEDNECCSVCSVISDRLLEILRGKE